MYKIVPSQNAGGRRLVALERLSQTDFDGIAAALDVLPREAQKIGFVAARRATRLERVETLWNGRETVADAQPGDWIATNFGADQLPLRDVGGHLNVYVIAADRFPELYQLDGGLTPYGGIYRSRAIVRALYLSGGFEILAPWGEMQHADVGYLINNGLEVYGNAKETFEKTYSWM